MEGSRNRGKSLEGVVAVQGRLHVGSLRLGFDFLQDALQNFGKLRGISARQTPGVQVGTIRNEFILALQVHVEEVSEHHQTALECLVAFLGRYMPGHVSKCTLDRLRLR